MGFFPRDPQSFKFYPFFALFREAIATLATLCRVCGNGWAPNRPKVLWGGTGI